MAVPSLKINLRSPYHLTLSESGLEKAQLDLYVYEGTTVTDRPATATYTLISTAYNERVSFEISELARDYLTQTFSGTYSSNTIWVDYQITKTVSGTPTALTAVTLSGIDGYGYFSDGVNPQLSDQVMMTNTKILKPDDSNFRIPVLQDDLTQVTWLDGNSQLATTAYSATDESTDIIRYVTNEATLNDDYNARVIADSGTIEVSPCSRKAFNTLTLNNVTKVVLEFTTGTKVIEIENIEECKYRPYKVTFVNKYGALQDMWFFKRHDFSIQTTEEKYKSNILSAASYNTYDHQMAILEKEAKESIRLNSGWIPESYNAVIQEMMLSDRVWIEVDSSTEGDVQTLPVMVKMSGQQFKQHVNEKLIDYAMDFEFAFDKINNVR